MKKVMSDLIRVLSMQFLVLLLILGLFAIGYFFRKDIQISYHKWGENAALKGLSKHSAANPDSKYEQYSMKHLHKT